MALRVKAEVLPSHGNCFVLIGLRPSFWLLILPLGPLGSGPKSVPETARVLSTKLAGA